MTRRSLLAGSLSLSLRQGKFDNAIQLIEQATSSGQVLAASFFVQQAGTVLQRGFGKAVSPTSVFLLASITKPMTATAVMTLVDRQQLALTDSVTRFIPEFAGDGRERVSIQHLLTHTSGLPDMLPENQQLRQRHAPLADFVARTCRTPLLFAPGSEWRYASMGLLLAAEIVSRITATPFPSFLHAHLFQPLEMRMSSLGLGGRAIADTMPCQVKQPSNWDWNSSYWRNLGSPWGGAFASAGDVARFLQYFAHPDGRVVRPATASAMITNHTEHLQKRWGLGWMLQNGQFGNHSSSATFGHSGSTGTLCWLDPKTDLTFVLLTTEPAEQSSKTLLEPVSDSVSTAASSVGASG